MPDSLRKLSVRSIKSDLVMSSTRPGLSEMKVKLPGLMMPSSPSPMEMTSRPRLNQSLVLLTQATKSTLASRCKLLNCQASTVHSSDSCTETISDSVRRYGVTSWLKKAKKKCSRASSTQWANPSTVSKT